MWWQHAIWYGGLGHSLISCNVLYILHFIKTDGVLHTLLYFVLYSLLHKNWQNFCIYTMLTSILVYIDDSFFCLLLHRRWFRSVIFILFTVHLHAWKFEKNFSRCLLLYCIFIVNSSYTMYTCCMCLYKFLSYATICVQNLESSEARSGS